MSTANWIASIGVSLLLLAFFLNSNNRISSKSNTYTVLNALGSLISAYASWLVAFYPFVVLNLIWCFAALFTFIKNRVSRGTLK